MKSPLITIVGVATAVACSGETAAPGACTSNIGCEAGSICLNSECAQICLSDASCASGEICVNSACQTGARSGAPEITMINGDGSPDGDPMHTPNHLANGLVISGTNLEGASVSLTDVMTTALVNRSVTDLEIIAELPSSITTGTYTVRVFNSVGEDQGSVTLLQGEAGPQGPPGSDANLTGSEIVTRINSAGGTILESRIDSSLVGLEIPVCSSLTVRPQCELGPARHEVFSSTECLLFSTPPMEST